MPTSLPRSTVTAPSFVNVVLVLGCKPNDDGTASPWLAARIDAAAALYTELVAAPDPGPTVLVVSGGAVGCKLVTEAEVMAEGLTRRHGVPERDIILEPEAFDTVGNGANTVALLLKHPRFAESAGYVSDATAAHGRQLRLWLLTSDFHVARGALIFAAVLRAASSGAPLRARLQYTGETASRCFVNDHGSEAKANWAALTDDQLAVIREILPAEHVEAPLAPLWGVAAAPSPGLSGARADERRLWELKCIGEQLPGAVAGAAEATRT